MSTANRLLVLFEELKQCPSVLVNWRSLGTTLGLTDHDVHVIQRQHRDVRRRCGAMLLRVFEQLRQKLDFNRDILLTYIKGLEVVGCNKIAGKMECLLLYRYMLLL